MIKAIPVVLLVLAANVTLWGQATQPTAAPRRAAATAHKSSIGPLSSGSLLNPASLKEEAPDVFKAKFTTTQGDFVIEVTRAWAPLGADRFYNLVKYHFYDGAAFFRVISGFMVQFGISARPEVNSVWQRAMIKDDPVTQSNTRGMVTFATGGPNTRTTQVFINFGDNSNLNKMGFSPFGKVIEGMEVVDKLYSGYGEGAPEGKGPQQDRIQNEGKAYLEKSFPKLDAIKTAVMVP
jgi:peptidyl-prolyl cis-trans isomerase A (cyclophilin A)